MEQRLANLEARDQLLASSAATPTPPMQAPVAPAATSAVIPPMQALIAPAATHAYTDNPCKRIKLDIPKFDGKNAESWIISFDRYCKILKLKTDEDILLAVGIAMTGKATLWWHHMEREVTTWQEAKEAVTSVYGDPRKKKDCANKLKSLCQGSMTISEFFVEVQNLNTYAQLDVETLPTFLEPGLNDDVRRAMEYIESLKPITTYKEWKEKALQQGGYLEASRKKDRKPTTNNPPSGRGNAPHKTLHKHENPTAAAAKERKPRTTQKLVPSEEKDRRMAAGECIKCGRPGHMGKECRTGWKYEPPTSSTEPTPTPSVKVMEGRKRARGNNQGNRESKKSKSDGSIQTMSYSDSGKD